MAVEACPSCGEWLSPRSDPQNRLLHAMLSDIAKQKQWAGQWLNVEDWKRLMVAAFARAQKDSLRILPAIDGQGFDVLYRRTSRMTKKEMIDLIEFVAWWCAENEVAVAA